MPATASTVSLAHLCRRLHVAWMAVTWPTRWLTTWLLLAAVYYTVFTPLALVFRLIGRDALRLRRRQCESYWIPKLVRADVRTYFRSC